MPLTTPPFCPVPVRYSSTDRKVFGHRKQGRRRDLPEYKSWQHIKERCTNPRAKAFVRYGGRGITVCRRWQESFTAFYIDMGNRPTPKHSVDRINNQLGYWCGSRDCCECSSANRTPNCRWATASEQSKNTSRAIHIAYDGRTLHLLDWAEETGIPASVLRQRFERGWSVHRAFTEPVHARGTGKKRTVEQVMRGIWCGINNRCFNPRSDKWKWYGGRGITVCFQWRNSFESFVSDMGARPTDNHSVDRIDADGHYSCGHCAECQSRGWTANCRWATHTEQVNNTSKTARRNKNQRGPRLIVATGCSATKQERNRTITATELQSLHDSLGGWGAVADKLGVCWQTIITMRKDRGMAMRSDRKLPNANQLTRLKTELGNWLNVAKYLKVKPETLAAHRYSLGMKMSPRRGRTHSRGYCGPRK